MSITLILGPMFSSKSTTLLSYERRFIILNKKYLCINHSFDTRYNDEGKITTHDGSSSSGANTVIHDLSMLNDNEIEQFEALIIDECQFFDDIDTFAEKWANKGKTIICAGLNSDFKKEQFENISKLISKSDKIIHLNSICNKCGMDAPFSKRIIENEEKTVIGGIESYVPRCRKCFNL